MSLRLDGAEPIYLVPTHTSGIVTTLTATQPVTFDTEPLQGDPDLSPALPSPDVTESQRGDSASLIYIAPVGEVQPGLWYVAPSEIGPYLLPSGAPSATASASFTAITPTFASNVTSPTGDFWSPTATSFSPDYVEPGESVTIPVTFTVTAPAGSVVRGSVNVDDTFLVDESPAVESLDAALAVSRWIEHTTGWSIRKFVKTARRHRTIEIQAGDHVITAADPLPGDLREALNKISNAPRSAH